MFTGIVEHLGTVTSVTDTDRSRTLTVDAGPLAEGTKRGDSVALNGICLTVTASADQTLTFGVMGETLDRTNLGALAPGDTVNLERPMPARGRFDGHIVQGHIDGVGRVRGTAQDETSRRLWVDVDPELLRYMVEKGSITVDGVSLTIARVDEDGFEVALIPHTMAVTTLGGRRPGDTVNLEVDVLAKYVERLLGASP